MTTSLEQAFDATCDGYSADRVVVDPEMNDRFIQACRQQGLTDPVVDLNRRLLNLRKRGGLAGRPRAKRTHFPNEEEYRFAAEIAVRFLERHRGVTLDTIMCDPAIAEELDKTAERIAPGYCPLQYRWAALNLRKARKLEPELVARVAPPIEVINVPVDELEIDSIPSSQGVYLFISGDQLLYVGETENLRTRMKKHLDHSDNKGLARWIWEFGTGNLHLEMQMMASTTKSGVRKALELEIIRSREPVFNVKR